MANEEPKRLKLSIKKSDAPVTPPSPGAADAGEAVTVPPTPPKADESSGDESSITDPMALKDSDTSKFRRVQPEGESEPTVVPAAAPAGAGLDATGLDADRPTETVRLKVVREKKKELANILTSSQTVRLRPSSVVPPAAEPAQPDTPAATPMPPSAPATGSTVKVELPPGGAPPTPPPPAEAPQLPGQSPAGTLKLRPGGAGKSGKLDRSASATLKIKAPRPKAATKESEDEASATKTAVPIPVPPEAPASSKLSLKVKPTAGGGDAGRTVKLPPGLGEAAKPEAEPAAETVASPPVGPIPETGATVQLDTPPAPGDAKASGLKLRKSEKPLGQAPIAEATDPGAVKRPTGADPGVMLTLASAAILAAMAGVTYFVVMQFLAHCMPVG